MLITSEIENVTNLNWAEIIIGVFILLVAFKFVWELIDWLIQKLGIKFSWKERNEKDHKTIEELSTSVNKISSHQDSVISTLNIIKEDVTELKSESATAKQADIELLYDRINQKSKYFINELHGIPEDEIEDFTRMFDVYEKRGGNHGLGTKVNYCLTNLPVLPSQKNN